jgi:hypothetical protein
VRPGSGGRGVIGLGTLVVIALVVLGLLALCAWIVFSP